MTQTKEKNNILNRYINVLKTNKKVFNISLIIAVSIVSIILILSIILLLFPGPKSKIKDYYSGMKNYNTTKVIKTFHEGYITTMESSMDTSYIEFVDETFKTYKDQKYKIKKYKIGKYKKYEDEEYKTFLDKALEYNISPELVEEVREYSVTTTIEQNKEKTTDEGTIIVAKIDSKWYVFAGV